MKEEKINEKLIRESTNTWYREEKKHSDTAMIIILEININRKTVI